MKSYLAKINGSLLLAILSTVVLYYGKPLLVPLFSAILLAMLMAPLCRRLDNKGWHRALSCLACVFLLLLVFLGMMGIMAGQIGGFIGNLEAVEERSKELLSETQTFVERRFEIPVAEQTAFLKQETANMGQLVRAYLTGAVRTSAQLLGGLIITLILTFLFLFHKEKYYRFFLRFTHGDDDARRHGVLNHIGQVAQHYLVGRAVSILMLFVLYALALLIIGIQNALLLAALAALFNIIPFLGPILAAVFPVAVALVTEPSITPAVWVLITFCLFQALDNYFVTPYFLGGEVSLSALTTIIGMIAGGFVWGVAGMILFIPLLSILKIIFDHLPGLEHYGALIGDEEEGKPGRKISDWLRKIRKRGR